ncbi:MAG TPA: ABC transporter ATP-binding protein [Desulfobacteria bacterium]|nr:ABC transporter ATP-binding protein [Desulfobacteria bacterium]
MVGSGLEIIKLTKTFPASGAGFITALDEITLSVRENEIVSIIGPSGCGKSTLLDIIAGLMLPADGQVVLDGQIITGQKGFVGYMPQNDSLFPWRTILDNVIVGLEIRGVNKDTAREQAKELLPVFGLEAFADCYPSALSGGMRQRASFLRTYLCKNRLMLLDEPFGRLDAITRMQMQKWLLDIWGKFRHTILFVTHDVDEAILLSDRVYVLSPRPGRITAEVEINLPRPRSVEISGCSDFAARKSEILHLLGEGETGRSSQHD